MNFTDTILKLKNYTNFLTEDFLGGPKIWKLSWVINFQKSLTFFFVLGLMHLYDNFRLESCIYLALHGGYGLVWLIKDLCFPDSAWQKRVTFAGGLMAFFGVLFWYWVLAWLLVSEQVSLVYPVNSFYWLALSVLLCLLGCVIMVISDAQKFYTLRIQKGLIKDGIHKYIRHPNYLGEMMIYGSFALIVWDWRGFVLLGLIWLFVFIPNIVAKEHSLSRHPGWIKYKQKSGWILPFL